MLWMTNYVTNIADTMKKNQRASTHAFRAHNARELPSTHCVTILRAFFKKKLILKNNLHLLTL